MKVLQVINSLGTGGAEKLLLETLPKYRAEGIEMDVLLLWDNEFPFAERLKELNCCKVIVLKTSNDLKDIYSLSHIPKLRRYIIDYDVIHVHLFPAQYFVALANIGIGKKLVFTEHSTTNRRMRGCLSSFIDAYIYRQYTKIVAISDDVRQALHKQIPNQVNKIIKIVNGVDLKQSDHAIPYSKSELHPSLKDSDIVICQVSAFRKGKDQKTLIRALSLLSEDYKLILVGDGEDQEKQAIERIIAELGLERRVFLLGKRMDVVSIVKSVDINVLSSDFEGLSLASLEGMASGKPFLASDVPGLRDIVDGAGLLFTKGDESHLAQLMQGLSQDVEYAEQVGATGLKRAKRYDIQKMVDKHVQLYEQLYADGKI